MHNLGDWFAMEFAFVPLLVLCVNELVKEEEKKIVLERAAIGNDFIFSERLCSPLEATLRRYLNYAQS